MSVLAGRVYEFWLISLLENFISMRNSEVESFIFSRFFFRFQKIYKKPESRRFVGCVVQVLRIFISFSHNKSKVKVKEIYLYRLPESIFSCLSSPLEITGNL